jgi:DNA-binding Xre family transcriptional regulator
MLINMLQTEGKRRQPMKISYKKLWKLLIDKKMNKGDLTRLSGVSTSTVSKLAKSENVNTDVLLKICETLQCDLADIGEVVEDEEI